jgi:inosine-uridine nucleoside N-ribohydrolase
MKVVASVVCVAIVTLATATLSAHMVTFKGTALAVEKESVTVNVVDPETKKTTKRVFVVDAETKVLRGDVVVTFVNARIQKGENISVTVDHDLDEELAQVIRLGAAK